jgi:UDP-N-acetylmuramate dehydrogenase
VSAEDPVEQAARLLGDRARRQVPLSGYTTYRVGGPAAVLVTLAGSDDLAALAQAVTRTGVAVLVVGRGSNLLVADSGFAGVAVVLGDAFAGIDIDAGDHSDPAHHLDPPDHAGAGPRVVVRAGAAASLPVVARQCAAAGLVGFEWAVGVPGSVGGAVRMNAGGHGSDMAASLVGVRVLDLTSGEDGWVPADRLQLSYRHSSIGPSQLVLQAELGLTRGDRERAEALIAEIVRWRRQHQPGGPNSGSVFTNPPGDSAGRLIDACGAKGLRVGTAEVSTKHANFIQVDEGGRADDVVALMAELQRRVADHSGVQLVPETCLVGFDNPQVLIEGL